MPNYSRPYIVNGKPLCFTPVIMACSESLQSHTEQSSWPGPKISSVEADVYIWRYALLMVHASKEEED